MSVELKELKNKIVLFIYKIVYTNLNTELKKRAKSRSYWKTAAWTSPWMEQPKRKAVLDRWQHWNAQSTFLMHSCLCI